MEDADEVIPDFIAEALARLAPSLRPANRAAAVDALRLAPGQVQEECRLLFSVALRPSENLVVEFEDTGGQQSEEEVVQALEVEQELQTDISFGGHDLAARVACCPEEAISVGLGWMACEAITRHQGCIDRVGGILAAAPVEEAELAGLGSCEVDIGTSDAGGTSMVKFVSEPCQARRVALGTALKLRAGCIAQAIFYLEWRAWCEGRGIGSIGEGC